MSLREKMKAQCMVKEALLPIPETDIVLLVRGATVKSGDACRAVYKDPKKPTPDEVTAFSAAYIISNCYDPDTKKPAFEAADADWLSELPDGVINLIMGKINELSGYNKKVDPVEGAAKN